MIADFEGELAGGIPKPFNPEKETVSVPTAGRPGGEIVPKRKPKRTFKPVPTKPRYKKPSMKVEPSGLGQMTSKRRLKVTRKFMKSVPPSHEKAVRSAIQKAEHGLGKIHRLKGKKYEGCCAIRTSKGGRIIFNSETGETIRYLPAHEY